MTRTWTGYGRIVTVRDGTPVYGEFYPTKRIAAMVGLKPVIELTATEDANGGYLGWLREGRDQIALVQREQLFEMQFPYGSKAEVEAGQGEIVRISLTGIEAD